MRKIGLGLAVNVKSRLRPRFYYDDARLKQNFYAILAKSRLRLNYVRLLQSCF